MVVELVRYHVSKNPVSGIEFCSQHDDDKPRGFWYGCGTEWIDFVNEEYESGRGGCLCEVSLNPDRMLFISNASDFIKFERRYGFKTRFDHTMIHWGDVAKSYGGIEICPYQWPFRMDHDWYYPWDVASGCVWNPSSIASIQEVRSSPADRSEAV